MSILYEHARAFGVELTTVQQEQFEQYYRLLVEWNERFNLTAITEYTAVQLKHFVDSLSAVPYLTGAAAGGKSLIDVGTGAGFPGMPLAIALPALNVTLLEATTKKVAFLDEVVRELALENTRTVRGRAEEYARDGKAREAYDFCAARALAPMRTLVEYTLPLVKVGGRVIAYKAVDAAEEAQGAERGIRKLGGELKEIVPVKLGELEDVRHLVIIDKVRRTPQTYPRGGGLPRSQPL